VVNPLTPNGGLIVPLTGVDVDVWGANDINPNMLALDGQLYGVQAVGLTNVPVTLTKPAGLVPTPSGGPTQSQNAILKLTGTLTGPVAITLPLPGYYIIDAMGVSACPAISLPCGRSGLARSLGCRSVR
jgi:hypothetical protein